MSNSKLTPYGVTDGGKLVEMAVYNPPEWVKVHFMRIQSTGQVVACARTLDGVVVGSSRPYLDTRAGRRAARNGIIYAVGRSFKVRPWWIKWAK